MNRGHGSRVDDSDSDLKGGPQKGPPAHAHNILHPLSDECAAPGPSGFVTRRSLTGWPRRHPTDPSSIPPSPCIIFVRVEE